MELTLKLFAGLTSTLPEGQGAHRVEVPEAATLADLLRAYEVPTDKPLICFRNGRRVLLDRTLHEGDVVSVFPPVGGG